MPKSIIKSISNTLQEKVMIEAKTNINKDNLRKVHARV